MIGEEPFDNHFSWNWVPNKEEAKNVGQWPLFPNFQKNIKRNSQQPIPTNCPSQNSKGNRNTQQFSDCSSVVVMEWDADNYECKSDPILNVSGLLSAVSGFIVGQIFDRSSEGGSHRILTLKPLLLKAQMQWAIKVRITIPNFLRLQQWLSELNSSHISKELSWVEGKGKLKQIFVFAPKQTLNQIKKNGCSRSFQIRNENRILLEGRRHCNSISKKNNQKWESIGNRVRRALLRKYNEMGVLSFRWHFWEAN
jgi:hypothetical protein